MPFTRRHRPHLTVLFFLAGALVLAGCGEGAPSEDRSHEITALHPWIRLPITPMADGGGEASGGELGAAPEDPETMEAMAAPANTAAYMVIQNPTAHADALVGVETPVARAAEIHSVTMEGEVMRMRQVSSVPIPAAGEAVLEPGGYHIMLIGLLDPLAEGDRVPLSLRLESGRVMAVVAPVRQGPPRP